MTSNVPEEPPREAIEAFLEAFPGQDEAAARRAWAESRQQHIATGKEQLASEKRRLHASAAVVTGVLIALADEDLARANMLIEGLEPADLPDAFRQLAGLLISMAKESGQTNTEIRAAFAELALRQAAAEDDDGGEG